MKNLFWRLLAALLARPRVAAWLIARAKRTPYFHLADYMARWWLFNPFEPTQGLRTFPRVPFAVRVHHIMREDRERHQHDHPWNARTIILQGWYIEQRLAPDGSLISRKRSAGDTATLHFGEYHHIAEVSPGGVHTLFITGPKQGSWGFLVDGVKVPWRTYLGEEDAGGSA